MANTVAGRIAGWVEAGTLTPGQALSDALGMGAKFSQPRGFVFPCVYTFRDGSALVQTASSLFVAESGKWIADENFGGFRMPEDDRFVAPLG